MKKLINEITFLPIILTAALTTTVSCKTIDIEKNRTNTYENAQDEELIEEGDMTDEEYITMEKMKENDIASAVVFLEPPEIIYTEELSSDTEQKVLKGKEALVQNLKDVTVLPEYKEGHLKAWSFKENKVYQIHTQTYHSSIIQLEPGEEMLEAPYISEPDVWRLSRGIGQKDGKQIQLIFVKPDYSGLNSTLTIVTNKRIYMVELQSYKDHYMPYVKWVYPQSIENTPSWTNWENQKKAVEEFAGQNAEYLSFDYKIRHPIFKKPIWTPVLVYDDGAKTYIVLDKKVLHMTFPAIFKQKKEIVNKEIRKNIIVINELVEKITLRSGSQKVTIIKKKAK